MNTIEKTRMGKRILRVSLTVLMAIASVSLLCSTVQAQLEAGSFSFNARADQTVRVFAGSPFGNTDDLDLQVSAVGGFSFSWEDEINGVAQISDFEAFFQGSHPILGDFGLVGGPFLPAFVPTFGSLENIDELNGNLVAADFEINTGFTFVLDSGAVIYTQETALFGGRLNEGLTGDVVSSPDAIDGFFFQGGDIANDSVVASSFNRTVTTLAAVPEPSSAVILACIGGMSCLLRRRSSKQPTSRNM